MAFVNILGGFFLLFIGGEMLVRGAITIAKKLNMSKLAIGVTIVAYGTSSPELLITLQAVLNGSHEIALGNVIGSNIANTLLVLGISSIIYAIHVEKELVKFDIRYLITASFALLFFVLTREIGRIEGLIFIAILIVYTVSTLSRHKAHHVQALENLPEEIEEQYYFLKVTNKNAWYFIALGIASLTYGGKILVTGAIILAERFGVSDGVVAVTIIAIGGSAPELATSIVAAIRKHSDIAIGNVLGSNIFNILGVLGISSLVSPIKTTFSIGSFDIWVLAFTSVLLYYFTSKKLSISRLNGVGFLVLYALYIAYQII